MHPILNLTEVCFNFVFLLLPIYHGMNLNSKISALIITYNEMGYIERCLDSVAFADEIIVVDSYSSDGTYEYLTNRSRIKTLQHSFQNYTAQKSFALKQASHDWVLFVDADEVVTDNLKKEILNTVNNPTEHVAYWFYRQFMFQDEKLHYSGWQTDKNHRLFLKDSVKFSEEKLVHEVLEVKGTSGALNEKLLHYCYKNFDDYKNKMLNYGRFKAKEAINRNDKFNYSSLLLKPAWKFVYHYFLRLGFLDGKKGIIICYLNALGDLEKYRELRKLRNEEPST